MLTVLQTGRELTGFQLASRLGVSARTLRRDAERLRELGYQVESRRGPGGGYRLGAGASVPPLVLEDDEAVAVQLGLAMLAASGADGTAGSSTGREGGALAEVAEQAHAKLAQLLPRRLRPRAGALREALEVGVPRSPAIAAEDLASLALAIEGRLVVRFVYRGSTSAEGPVRRVEPHRLLHRYGRWYLWGWDRERTDWRTFRLDRMRAHATTGARFPRRELPADAGMESLARGVQRDRLRAVLEVGAGPAEIADALPFEDLELEVLQNRRRPVTRVTAHVRAWQWVPHLLGELPGEARILEPESVRDEVLALARRTLAAHADEKETNPFLP